MRPAPAALRLGAASAPRRGVWRRPGANGSGSSSTWHAAAAPDSVAVSHCHPLSRTRQLPYSSKTVARDISRCLLNRGIAAKAGADAAVRSPAPACAGAARRARCLRRLRAGQPEATRRGRGHRRARRKLRDPAAGPLDRPRRCCSTMSRRGWSRFDAARPDRSPGSPSAGTSATTASATSSASPSGEWPDGRKITAQQVARILKRQLARAQPAIRSRTRSARSTRSSR